MPNLNLTILIILIAVSFCYSEENDDEQPIAPTLLSSIHSHSKEYINALDNPLYEELKTSIFLDDLPQNFNLRRRLTETTSPSILANKNSTTFGDSLTISWNEDANDEDVIALYCPAHEADPKKFRDAVTVYQAKKTKNDPSSSNSSWHIPSFPIIRESTCEFRLWKRYTAHPNHSSDEKDNKTWKKDRFLYQSTKTHRITLTKSQVTPTGIHLSLTTSPDQMRVHFATGETGVPLVYYGKSNPPNEFVAIGTSTTYGATDMCHPPATLVEPGKFSDPGFLHTITLSGLDPNETYYYKVRINSNVFRESAWSDIYAFKTPPAQQNPPPSQNDSFSIIVYGDQGAPSVGWDGGYLLTTKLATREVLSGSVDMVHIVGDLSYADGASHVWDSWLRMIQPFAARIPVMTAVGNHDYGHDSGGENGKDPSGVTTPWGYYKNDNVSGGECGVPYAKRFPGSGNGNGAFWYSFDYRSLHTVVISSEHDLTAGKSVQYEWLEKDLRGVDRVKTPWVVVECHRPMYMTKEKGEYIESQIGEILIKYQVDLFISGHRHFYGRSCKGLYQSRCEGKGPIQIIVGTGGWTIPEKRKGPCEKKLRDWMEACFEHYGYGKISIVNNSALHWEFVGDEAGNVLDDVWIYKD